MSISTIVTRGYSIGSSALVVTRGYSIGEEVIEPGTKVHLIATIHVNPSLDAGVCLSPKLSCGIEVSTSLIGKPRIST